MKSLPSKMVPTIEVTWTWVNHKAKVKNSIKMEVNMMVNGFKGNARVSEFWNYLMDHFTSELGEKENSMEKVNTIQMMVQLMMVIGIMVNIME